MFVSVQYRLTLEYSFPVAVDDGLETVLYLAASSEEYGIDPQRVALSVVSAGGNMAFTLRLKIHGFLENACTNTEKMPSFISLSIISFHSVLDSRKAQRTKRAACKRPRHTLPPILTDVFDAFYMPDKAKECSPIASRSEPRMIC